MTNLERLQKLKTPEEVAYVHFKLQHQAIYAEGRLLMNNPSDFVAWLNKESGNDDDSIFDNKLSKCPKCGSLPTLVECPINHSFNYHCYGCGFSKYNPWNLPKNQFEALIEWNK